MEERETIHPHHAKKEKTKGEEGVGEKNLLFPESSGTTEQQNLNKAILITMKSKPHSSSRVLLLKMDC